MTRKARTSRIFTNTAFLAPGSGNGHVRVIAAGADGGSLKAIAFRAAEEALGQQLLHGAAGRKLWLAGRVQLDDWGSRPAAELHLTDAAWAD